MENFIGEEKIYYGFSNFNDILNLLKELQNNNKELTLPNKESILNEKFLTNISNKINNFNDNTFITQEELISINDNLEVDDITMIDPQHFYIWQIGTDGDMLSWSVKTLKEDIINNIPIMNINNKKELL